MGKVTAMRKKKALSNVGLKVVEHPVTEPMPEPPKVSLTEAEEIGEKARTMLLPEEYVESKTVRIISYARSCEQYGGDWWGWAEVPRKGRLPVCVLMIGDATGHGAPSALVAASVRGALSCMSTWMLKDFDLATDPREVLKLMNRAVWDAARGAVHMTMGVVVLDPQISVIRCSNAGHNFPYVVSPGEPGRALVLRAVGEGGVPLGSSPTTDYTDVDTYTWNKGSKIFLYTDGLTECYEGEKNLYDRRQLQKALRKFGNESARETMDQLIKERSVCIKGLPPKDDVTVVICEVKGERDE